MADSRFVASNPPHICHDDSVTGVLLVRWKSQPGTQAAAHVTSQTHHVTMRCTGPGTGGKASGGGCCSHCHHTHLMASDTRKSAVPAQLQQVLGCKLQAALHTKLETFAPLFFAACDVSVVYLAQQVGMSQ